MSLSKYPRNASPDLELDKLLREYKKHAIDLDEILLVENRKIAEKFVKDFIVHLQNTTGLKFISLHRQGSAFENVQVFTPNEFDYILVFAAKQENIPNDEIADDLRSIHQEEAFSEDKSVQYHSIQIPGFVQKHEEYNMFCKDWPGTKQKCMSSHKMSDWYKDEIFKYWRNIKKNPEIDGVKRVEQPRHHDPALTTVLLKTDGTNVSVDMSVCIRLYGPDEDKFYIAKRPNTIDPYMGHRACVLWLPTHSMEERDAILSKFEYQRDNYKIVKALLYRQELIAEDNAYIIKTIFLRDDDETRQSDVQTKDALLSESPSKYLSYFLDTLERAYTRELTCRVEDICDKNDEIQGYMNPQENVLARYGTNLIERKLHQLKKLIKLRDNDSSGYRRQLMSKDLDNEKLKEVFHQYKIL